VEMQHTYLCYLIGCSVCSLGNRSPTSGGERSIRGIRVS
jgi:hypothetical protein